MPGPDQPELPPDVQPDMQPDVPPDVPEEFAAAYREAYARALATGAGHAEAADAADQAAGAGPVAVSARATSPADLWDDWRASRWFVPSLVAALAVLLVLVAYVAGRLVSGDDDTTGTASPTASPSGHTGGPSRPARSPSGKTWTGAVSPVTIGVVRADCTAKPSVDSAGHRVAYRADNVADGDPTTAWRCPGRAIGRTLVLHLPAGTAVAEVGLVPGYAKTDEASGADRYAENNRITRVRWTFDDGTSVVQEMKPDPKDRSMRRLRVPRTTTRTLRLEVLAVAPGPRNTTAISEVVVAAAAG